MTEEVRENDTPKNEDDQDINPENESEEDMVEIEGKKMTKKEAYEDQKIRAEKAEKKLKALEKKMETETPKKEKPDEPDDSKKALENSQKALLNSLGYKHEDQHKYVLDEAKRLQKDVSEIINDDYHKSKLKDINDKVEAQDGMGKGKSKAGGATPDSVDYYIAKGEAPNDPELREKYFAEREKQETNENMFSDELYTSAESETKMAE